MEIDKDFTQFQREALSNLGQYEVGEVIGFGSNGMVFAARDLVQDEDVAVKVLRKDKRSLLEFVLQSWVRHLHILPVRGFSETEDFTYVATELVRGGTVRDLLKSRDGEPLEPRKALTIVHQTALALDALHKAGIAHRDIAPRNLFLANPIDDDGPVHVLLADLGAAVFLEDVRVPDSGNLFLIEDLKHLWPDGPWKELPDLKDLPPPDLKDVVLGFLKEMLGRRPDFPDSRHSGLHTLVAGETGERFGNPCYMAPEAYALRTYMTWDRDGRADQYSLGAVAHELLTGRRPADGLKDYTTEGSILKNWRVKQRELSDALYAVLKRSLDYGPEGRFDSILDFSAALGKALGVEPLPSPRPQTGVREASFTDVQHSLQKRSR